MNDNKNRIKASGLDDSITRPEDMKKWELGIGSSHKVEHPGSFRDKFAGLYEWHDMFTVVGFTPPEKPGFLAIQTLDELLERDKQREADGLPRRIKIGKIMKPGNDKNKNQIVIVPSTTEPKFYHDSSITEEDDGQTGGSGEGEEGEVIGEQQAQPEPGEGEGQGAGSGEGEGHDITSDAFELGRVLTQKFQLPNLKVKGTKRSFTKYIYELTDKNRGFGQFLDKKATLQRLVKTNILLGRVDPNADYIKTEDMIINPQDMIYKILSAEKDFETQATVFFLRDYSGSMQGKPTETVVTQHLFIYSWLMYQYQNNVSTRFIVHDNTAKEVPDFYTYHNSAVAGGTNVYPAFELVNKIVEEEQLARENNIYVFYGTDGDDWNEDGHQAIEEVNKMLTYTNRLGITVAKNSWGSAYNLTTVEKYMMSSGLLTGKPELLRMDAFRSDDADENRLIEGIKKLIS